MMIILEKRSELCTSDKDLGPIVKTVMTCCIHCTRCVRFARLEYFGIFGQGKKKKIGTYIDKILSSDLSGKNVIDLCPVGYITKNKLIK